MKQEEINKDLLDGIPKDNPFKVPDGYFESFAERIQERIENKPVVQGKRKDFIRVIKPVLWLAASFLLVMLLVQFPIKTFFPNYQAENDSIENMDESVISIASLDDDNFYDLLSEDLNSESVEQEVLTDYLSTELSDLDIYTELN